MSNIFPFGQTLRKVGQQDKTPKNVFILGVYASAVHAKWLDKDGKEKVKALAVASEPEIFWRGDNADIIISNINIPNDLGSLLPANKIFNGPSGIALDRKFLDPLGVTRKDVWLCDLLPYTRINPKQRLALEKNYTPELLTKYNLPRCTIPNFSESELNDRNRVNDILMELVASNSDLLITLGDLPIKYFINKISTSGYSKLSDYGKTIDSYGKTHTIKISNKKIQHLPLVHPRQAGRLGKSSITWHQLHNSWINSQAQGILHQT